MALRPPEGFASWLDYAVATADTRAIELARLFAEDEAEPPTRAEIRRAIEDELAALRRAAGVGPAPTDLAAASDGLVVLRWKPPDPPAMAAPMRFPEDVERLVQVARRAGYALSAPDAELAWSTYSESLCAGWLSLGDDDAWLLRTLLAHTVAEPGEPARR